MKKEGKHQRENYLVMFLFLVYKKKKNVFLIWPPSKHSGNQTGDKQWSYAVPTNLVDPQWPYVALSQPEFYPVAGDWEGCV